MKMCSNNPAMIKNKSLAECQKEESNLEKSMASKMSKDLIEKVKIEIEKKLQMAFKFKFLGINNQTRLSYLLRNKTSALHIFDTADDEGQILKKNKFFLELEHNTEQTDTKYLLKKY